MIHLKLVFCSDAVLLKPWFYMKFWGFSCTWIQENAAGVVNCKNIEVRKFFNYNLKLSKLFKLCFLNAYFLDTWLQWYNHGLQKKKVSTTLFWYLKGMNTPSVKRQAANASLW